MCPSWEELKYCHKEFNVHMTLNLGKKVRGQDFFIILEKRQLSRLTQHLISKCQKNRFSVRFREKEKYFY